jgi:hypothetical protein
MYDDLTTRAKSWIREIEEAGYPVLRISPS